MNDVAQTTTYAMPLVNYGVQFSLKKPNSKALPLARRDRWAPFSTAEAAPLAYLNPYWKIILVPSFRLIE
jgi:hypothetical protein